MTQRELEIELLCYKEYVNPDCDFDNMSKDELEEFYHLYIESENYYSNLDKSSAAKVVKDGQDNRSFKRIPATYKL